MGATNVNEVSMGTNDAAITDWDKVPDLLQLPREDNAEEPIACQKLKIPLHNSLL